MAFLGRGIKDVAKAAIRPHQYRGLFDLTRVFDDPGRVAMNYVFRTGTYPTSVTVATPIGKKSITLYTVDDLITVNEIFARKDYYVDEKPRVILDFGSNIGVSIAYFLTRNQDNFVYGYEPAPVNIDRLKHNLTELEGRYAVFANAVGVEAGSVEFATDETNRYGGIGRTEELQAQGRSVTNFTVECLEANAIIATLVDRHGKIDVLKVDIDGAGETVLRHIRPDLISKIDIIYSEGVFPSDLLASTHIVSTRGMMAKFVRRAQGVLRAAA